MLIALGHYTPEARSVAFDVDRGILVHRSTDPRAPASSDGFVDIMLSPRVPNNMDEAVNLFPSKEPMVRTAEHVLQNNDSDPTPFLGMSKTDAVEEEMLSYSQIEHGDNQSPGNSLALIREIMQLERQIWRQTMTSAMKKSIELKKSLDRHQDMLHLVGEKRI